MSGRWWQPLYVVVAWRAALWLLRRRLRHLDPGASLAANGPCRMRVDPRLLFHVNDFDVEQLLSKAREAAEKRSHTLLSSDDAADHPRQPVMTSYRSSGAQPRATCPRRGVARGRLRAGRPREQATAGLGEGAGARARSEGGCGREERRRAHGARERAQASPAASRHGHQWVRDGACR